MISLIKSLFGGSSAAQKEDRKATSPGDSKPPAAASAAPDDSNVAEFVEFVVKSLVDNPGDVVVKTVEKDRLSVFEITCQKADIGKIIGRNGKTIGAIRALASGAAGRVGKKVAVEVMD